jgi:hypothetical protein
VSFQSRLHLSQDFSGREVVLAFVGQQFGSTKLAVNAVQLQVLSGMVSIPRIDQTS